jgi:hypothetical protein
VAAANSFGLGSYYPVTFTIYNGPTPSPTPTPSATPSPTGQPLTVSASPTSISGSGTTSANTVSTTATATGGTGAYRYVWTVQSGTPFGLTGAFSNTVYCSYGGAANTYTAVLLCTVTDSLGNQATCTVNASITLSL